jgi:hypothetical protein
LRSVTARAVQRVLARLAVVDRASHSWLSAFVQQNPPIAPGFVAALLAEPPVAVPASPEDASSSSSSSSTPSRVVNPSQLASAVLVTRAELAADVARSLEDRAARDNVATLREHLSRHTWVTANAAPPRLRYRAGVSAAASQSVELWRELRRRAPPPSTEGGEGGGRRGGGGGGGASSR